MPFDQGARDRRLASEQSRLVTGDLLEVEQKRLKNVLGTLTPAERRAFRAGEIRLDLLDGVLARTDPMTFEVRYEWSAQHLIREIREGAAERERSAAIREAEAERAARADEFGGRPRISREIQMFVWQRDDARCVQCGSNQNLEFDHIIPFSMGGSSTARNLQLLCESCNRSKGADFG